MTDSTLIADLIRAGVEPELIGRIVNLVLSATVRGHSADITDMRRMKDRLRKKKSRGKSNTSEANDADVSSGLSSVLSADKADNRCNLLSSLTSKSLKEKKELVERGRRGSRLLAGAEISSTDFQFARDQGFEPMAISKMWVEFIDYWVGVPGQRGMKLDWSATWRNRVRQCNGAQNDKSKSLLAAIKRQQENLGGAGAVDYKPQLDPILRLPPR